MKITLTIKKKCNTIFLAAVYLHGKEVKKEVRGEGQKNIGGALRIVGRNDG